MSSSSIQLKAKAPTDIWRKPPSTDVSNAPKHTQQLNSQGFRKARVTVSAPWTRLYDQGGLLILLPTSPSAPGKRPWIKAGIEFVGGRANISVVVAREFADWSLHPLDGGANSVTIQIERGKIEKGKGSSLYVYIVNKNGEKDDLPLREVTSAFEREGEIEVGVYAARPTKLNDNDEDELIVNLVDIDVDFDL